MNEQPEELKDAKYLGKVCPITDGSCDRKCGHGAHMTIKRAPVKLKNRIEIPVDPAEANICDGCE